LGAEARFKRFNDMHEIPGIKIQYVTTGDDQSDPATALSVTRQLVTSDNVFAIVPDLSEVNPTTYDVQQQVLHVGLGLDASYCAPKQSTSLWGFGIEGCQISLGLAGVPVPDTYSGVYKFLTARLGITHPTVALINTDTQGGKENAITIASQMTSEGFNVVYDNASLPLTVSDYTPYLQQWLNADHGKQPNMIVSAATNPIAVYDVLKAAGFRGTYFSALGPIPVLGKSLAVAPPVTASITIAFYNTAATPAMKQLQSDLSAFAPGTAVSETNVFTYEAADEFIAALKTAVKEYGRQGITTNRVQHIMATQSWGIPGLVGPAQYPASTVLPTPNCAEILTDNADGSFSVAEPYTCNGNHFQLSSKFTGGAQNLP
jgi:hypothetical protein